MTRRVLSWLAAGAGCVIGLSAGAVTTSKNIDIVVTHAGSGGTGTLITTATIKETTGVSQPAGKVYIAGQAFRRGDVPAGNCVQIRDAASHVPLVYQIDQISTRHYNSDDGSLFHVAWSVQLPAMAGNSTYTVEFVTTGAPCAEGTQKQPLSALNGQHDIKVRFTDVRNQDGSLRDSGSATFSVAAAAANTGRDAPRKCATGSVRDCWMVMGPPIYDTTGHPDPLLYVVCYLDLTTNPADQTSLGDVRHICRVDNPWENVTASNGGFVNDPQGITYRPQLLDGTSSLIDWSWLDQSVDSASNPVDLTGCPSACSGFINVPGQGGRGTNEWFYAQPVFYSTTGTPPVGLTNNTMYYVYPFQRTDHSFVQLDLRPWVPSPTTNISSQGSGIQNFSFRVYQPKWMSWYTTDQSAKENWTNGTARTTNPFYPAMTPAEQLYWQQSGAVIPIDLKQTPDTNILNVGGSYLSYNYNPLSRASVTGGSGGGSRPDLGLLNEWASQAFILQTPTAWDRMRLFGMAHASYPYSVILNEATGHVPALNNGPPGPDGNGVGTPYAVFGAPQPGAYVLDCTTIGVLAPPLEDSPLSGSGYCGGLWGPVRGYRNDHVPSFNNLMFAIFGSAHYLDALSLVANRSNFVEYPNDSEGTRDQEIGGKHYYGLTILCCENRGAAWAYMSKAVAAAYGEDARPERDYFHDQMVEINAYWQAYKAWKDGPYSGYRKGFILPGGGFWDQTYIDGYVTQSMYTAYVLMRDATAKDMLFGKIAPLYNALCGGNAAEGGNVDGALSAWYCASYGYNAAAHDAKIFSLGGVYGPNIGYGYNDHDASDMGQMAVYTDFTPGSNVLHHSTRLYEIRDGDLWHVMSNDDATGTPPAELASDVWYKLVNTNMHNDTGGLPEFQLVDPATGKPFPAFTARGGGAYPYTPLYAKFRPSYSSPTGYFSLTYMPYADVILKALHILGDTVTSHAYSILGMRGGGIQYNPQETAIRWDGTVAVP